MINAINNNAMTWEEANSNLAMLLNAGIERRVYF
jgi:hypothetical protein